MNHNALRLALWTTVSQSGRTLYLVTIVLVAAAAYLCLATLASPFMQPRVPADAGGIFISSASQGVQLPARYARRVEALPGTRDVAWLDSSAVTCRNGAPPISLNGAGGPGARIQALGVPQRSADVDAQVDAWVQDPLGVLIGTQVAATCGWRAGEIVSPTNLFTGGLVELHVIGVRPPQKNPIADQIALVHYAYLNRLQPRGGGRDRVFAITVTPSDPRAAPELAARIEEEFAHDDPPVAAMTTVNVQNGLVRFGQAQYVLGCVMLAILLCTALVLVSALAYAAAERRPQMALLQVLGFSRTTLWAGFALQALLIVAVGAAIGIGAGFLVLRLLPAALAQFFTGFRIPTSAWWGLPAWLAALLVVAMVIPTFTIRRLRPVDVRAS